MRRYSASEAIGPAWSRTTEYLWRGRRKATALKLCFVALLAEMSLGWNWTFWMRNNSGPAPSPAVAHVSAALGIVIGFIIFLVGLVFIYIGSRLQLSFYDMFVRDETYVLPTWRKYGNTTWRWIGIKLAFIALMLAVTIPATILMIHRLAAVPHGDPRQAALATLGVVFGFMGYLIPISLLIGALYWALRDFVMPSLVLEDTTIGFALHRFRLFLAAEPGPIVGYIALRALLTLVFGIACYIAFAITAAITALPFIVVGLIAWAPVRNAGTGAHFAMGAVVFLLVLTYIAWVLLLSVAFFGTLVTFYMAWSTYFLAGRYPLLAELLEPTAATLPYTPPPSFPTEDDSSGPDLPMNPEPAS